MLRNDRAFALAMAQRLVARHLAGKKTIAEAVAVYQYAERWDIDPVMLGVMVGCEAELLMARVTKHEDKTRGE